MHTLGVIPARYNSSRFPGKPLIDLKGKSMIQRVYEGVKKSNSFDNVVVATDDKRIYDHVISFGGQVVMTSSSHQTGTDRCGEVAQLFPDSELIVNIQGDEPLVNSEQLEKLILAFQDDTVEIATLGNPSVSTFDLTNPNRIKLVKDLNNNALYFSRSAIPFGAKLPNDQWVNNYPYLRHIGLYAFKSETLKKLIKLTPTPLEEWESLEQLRWIYYGYKIRIIETNIETPNIDTPDDVQSVLDLLN
jgi:3-deoxy-manno-octulosonate cytidylyltransferase (CMP-KDO synthetase)